MNNSIPCEPQRLFNTTEWWKNYLAYIQQQNQIWPNRGNKASQDDFLCVVVHFCFLLVTCVYFQVPSTVSRLAAATLSQEHTRLLVTWSNLCLSLCLCCRMEQFQASQWRRMKTPGEGTGATRLSLSSPVWAMLWAWVTSGGSPTSATEMEEVHVTAKSLACFFGASGAMFKQCTLCCLQVQKYKMMQKTGWECRM